MDSRTIFGVLGCLTAFITFLMPARVLYKIWNSAQERSTNHHQYHATIVSCALWVMYGQVHPDQFLVIISTTGFIVHICYLALFLQTIHLKQSFTRTHVDMLKNYGKHLAIVLGELFCSYLLAYRAVTSHDPGTFAGTVCAAGTTIICVMRMLYEPKREPVFCEFLASFANGFVWTVYALISSDRFILVPNLVGGILGMVQMVYFVIRQRSGQGQRQISEEIGLMLRTEP